ncbi:MAG: LysM peptidoglycan-binding domain-containing protein [Gammaproteobacteria bacterium]
MPKLRLLAAILALGALSGCAVFSPPPVTDAAPDAATITSAAVGGTVPAAASAVAAASAGEPAPPEATSTAPVTDWQDLTIKGTAPVANLWLRIRKGFSLPDGNEARVQAQMSWYRRHPNYMKRTALRAQPYLYYIVGQLQERGMPTDLALLPVVESAYDPYAYSSSRASGLWQFIASTGRLYGLRDNWWYDGRRDFAAATKAALDYLQDLHKRFDGSWLLALAAYNSGGLTVERAMAHNRRHGLPTDFWHLHLPRQTRAYVPRLLAVRDLVAEPAKYGIDLPFIPNAPYLAKIELHGQIDLAIAANMAGLSVKQMYLLNPGYSRWASPPENPSALYIPRAVEKDFRAKLASMKQEVAAKWIAHKIRSGETLGGIANHYHTSIAVLRQRNDIHGNLIRAGHTLMIPSPSAQFTRYVLASPAARLAAARSDEYSNPRIVRVRSGDSLWGLAHTYHVSVADIASWNHISRHATLHIGQKLKILPGRGARSLPPPPVAASEHRRIRYTVRHGDSLWSISDRFNVSLRKLANWNSISLSSILHPGQRLTLFVDNSG